MQTGKQTIILLMAGLFLFSCGAGSLTPEERGKKAAQSKGDIVIGVVDSSFDPSLFTDGVKLAVAEINEQGGPLGRKIRPLFYDDRRYLNIGQNVARKLAAHPDVVAVLGHRYSGVAVPVSIIYENNGIVFISTGATDPNFTQYGGAYTFRNMLSDSDTGKETARMSYQRGYTKMAVFYERETAGQRLADIFSEEADRLGIDIVAVRSYFKWQTDFKNMASELARNYQFDAVFVAGLLPFAGELIKQARMMGISVPFIGSHSLDSPELFTVAGKSAEHVIVPSVFNPDMPSKSTRDFVKKFRAKFGVMPDTWAAQGYDAVQLLAYAVEKSGSAVPIAMGSALRFLEKWKGATGSYSFKMNGDISGKEIFFKELRNGKFEMLDYEMKEEISPFYVVEEITLRLPVEGIITTIDPGFSQDISSIEAIEQMFLGLTDFDPKTYQAVPELAESWSVSDDGKTYRFKLREDAKWTNGRAVTAHDIVWAIQRNIKPESRCPSASMLYILKNAKEISSGNITDVSQIGVRAPDDFTAEFELEHPAAYFPGMAGLAVYRPLPRETVEEYKERWTEPEHIQTNGSYKLAFWDKGMLMILRKNPNYYEAQKVSIPEVRFYIIPESAVGLVMYENNELDITGGNYLRLPFARLDDIKVNPHIGKEYSRAPMFATYSYGFNTKRPPMDNPLVRKAICAAVDRQFLIDLVTKSGEAPATTYTPPPILGSVAPEEGVGIGFDPLQAKKWLAEAGYPDGKGFPEIELLYNASKTHSEIARALAASLAYYLNIRLRLKEETWDNYVKYLYEPDTSSHHIFRFGWSVDYPDANNILNELFNPRNPNNFTGWDNAEFSELMAKALETTNPEERKAFYRRAEQILCEEHAVIFPLYFEAAHCLVKPRVKGWYHMAIGGQHIRNWSLKN